MSTTTLERSHSCTSSTSLSMSSPRLPVRRETTPPGSELSLFHIHDRMNQLDSRVLELRATILTQDGYVDRRNREDEHIRREFENHRAISQRIDLNVVALRSDVEQIKTNIFQLKSSVGQSGTETVFLRGDVDRLQKAVDQLQSSSEQMKTDACATRIDISRLQTATNQLRTDLVTLEHKLSHQLKSMESRFTTRMDSIESRMDSIDSRMNSIDSRMNSIDSRMRHSERVRFNSLAHTVHAPISPVPLVTENGSLEWPAYFPRTVWRFWCLKKRSRVHRLIELAEFYQLGDYQDWCRMHPSDMFADDSDSSSSSDGGYNNITRAEAVRQFPEAAHQALAATLGLIYYKIRNEVGEGHNAPMARPPKRHQDEVASTSTSNKSKPVKIPRRPSVSDSFLHRLVTGGPSVESKSSTSEEFDKLGWNAFADVSDDAMSKLRSIDPQDIGMVLRALEQGRLKLKPSRSEKLNMSPTGSKAQSSFDKADKASSHGDRDRITVPTVPNTVPTQPVTSVDSASRAHVSNIPETASDSDSSTS
ncbi:hypothetical protein N7462_004841 [Penicillium macrosclerotiorum]|uniref:uncharacterized protein n=1 Tax=Penicillium macrosclerotiorum TaxID=303699 RepID=UPI002549A74D|nr:uncharacterized protein N7462_004841 [Penicillium macrosclerotiorum]KAJ5690449.1 hypothetical protein N7462_004841 [Penicillium macrosclerotiorum]